VQLILRVKKNDEEVTVHNRQLVNVRVDASNIEMIKQIKGMVYLTCIHSFTGFQCGLETIIFIFLSFLKVNVSCSSMFSKNCSN